MEREENSLNQKWMHLIKRAHGILENSDLEKHRQSQDTLGSLLGNSKELTYQEIAVDGLYAEWVVPNRAHIKKYVILHCHGGGYSTGSSLYARTLTSKMAMATGMEVLSFDYRLAPEHPFPAALEDAEKVWNNLLLQGYGAEQVMLTGDSAGGNLALALTLKLKKEGRRLPAGLFLMSPWTDLTSSGESFIAKASVDPVLNQEYINKMIQAYAPNRELRNPLISPLFGEFSGFPPVYIQVGENEILLSDSLRLQKTLEEAGVQAEINTYEGMWHVFQMSPLKITKEAMNQGAEFIYRTFGL